MTEEVYNVQNIIRLVNSKEFRDSISVIGNLAEEFMENMNTTERLSFSTVILGKLRLELAKTSQRVSYDMR